jgi:hypothetical protein
MTKNCKILQLKKSQKCNFFSLIFHEGHSSYIQEKPSTLKRENPALRNIKFLNFSQFLWVILALVDPDPADHNLCNSMRIRIHNTESFVIIVLVKLRTLDLDCKTMGEFCATKVSEDFAPCVFRIR